MRKNSKRFLSGKVLFLWAVFGFGGADNLYSQSYYITTVAGGGVNWGISGNGGPATAEEIGPQCGVTQDDSGNIFISDFNYGLVQKVNTSGIIMIVAGEEGSSNVGNGGPATEAGISPAGTAVAPSGIFYISSFEDDRIRMVNTHDTIYTIAGNGVGGYSGDRGPATAAQVFFPEGICLDNIGNIYIADYFNYRIRKIDTTGIISTIAGTSTYGYSGDGGPATAAELFDPMGVGTDASGNVFIADYFNNRIRIVNTHDTIYTIAGNGTGGYNGDNIAATSAELNNPMEVSIDNIGNVFIADKLNNRIRMVNTNGIISTIAGNGIAGYNGDYIAATAAELNNPGGVSADNAGNIYIADGNNALIRKLIPCTVSSGAPTVSQNVSCYGESNGSAVAAIPTGGLSPYTYLWSSGPFDTNYSVTGLSAGTYTLSVTDNHGCNINFSISVTQPNALNVAASVITNTTCRGLSIGGGNANVSGGTSPYTYLWSNNATTALVSGLSAGTYTVTVSDYNGCSATCSLAIGLYAEAFVTGNVNCYNGSNGSAIVSLSGAVSPYSYLWSDANNQTTSTATGLIAGSFSVTVNDSCGASATASVTITQPPSLFLADSIIMNVSCYGGSNGLVSVFVRGGTSPYTYMWTDANSQTNSSATGLSAGAYTVIVSDSCGSTVSASVVITQPDMLQVSIGSLTNSTCYGSNNGSATVTISGGVSPFTYLWSDDASQTTLTAYSLSAGTYTFTVSDSCGNTATASTTISQPPLLSLFPLVTSTVLCNGYSTGSVYATGSGGVQPYTYTWQWTSVINGSQSIRSDTLAGLSAGTYYIYLEDSNGCYAGRDSVVITQPTAITGTTTIINSITNCNGGNVGSISVSTTGGVPPYTYRWSDVNNQTTDIATGLSAGNYTVSITDSTGCTSFASNTFTLPNTLSDSVKVISTVGCNGGNTGSATILVPGSRSVVQNYYFEPAVQHFSVPPGINTVAINIGGASGGKLDSNFGGNGASFSGVCPVIPGHILSVVVGQEGESNGGGGASWVYDSNVVLYNPVGTTGLFAVAAGGGGGGASRSAGGRNYYSYFGASGGTDLVLNSATYSSLGSDSAGSGGHGGAAGLGGGGAGWLSNGENGRPGITGGMDEANHFLAVSVYSGSYGGFGGGGANGIHTMMGSSNFGGGGGGYNGGGSGSGGGGGGSYFINTSPIVTANDTGNGFVTISYSVGAGIPPFTYLWSNGETTDTATGLSSGVYTITVEDSTGCSITAAVTITQAPGPSLSTFVLSTITCFGENNSSDSVSVSGGVSPYTYLWNDANSQTTITATGLNAGTYIVTVTDSSGCSASAAITISQPQLLTVSTTLVSNVNCPGRNDGSASCQASGGTEPYTYSWTGGGTDSLYNYLSVGTYTITVTDNNGCQAIDSIAIIEAPFLNDSIVLTNVTCNGDSNGSITAYAREGDPPYVYSWSQGGTTSSISGLSAGSYTVQISDDCGAIIQFLSISQPPPLSIITDSINATSGRCNGSAWAIVSGGTNPYSYLWTGGLTTDTILNQCTNYYCCTITDANGCMDSACVNIEVSTGTNELTMDNGQLTIYPNPNNGVFILSLSNISVSYQGRKYNLEIYDVLGEEILAETLRFTQADNSIDLSGQPNGVYLYRVIEEDGSLIGEGKIIIEK